MINEGVCRTVPATPGLLNKDFTQQALHLGMLLLSADSEMDVTALTLNIPVAINPLVGLDLLMTPVKVPNLNVCSVM